MGAAGSLAVLRVIHDREIADDAISPAGRIGRAAPAGRAGHFAFGFGQIAIELISAGHPQAMAHRMQARTGLWDILRRNRRTLCICSRSPRAARWHPSGSPEIRRRARNRPARDIPSCSPCRRRKPAPPRGMIRGPRSLPSAAPHALPPAQASRATRFSCVPASTFRNCAICAIPSGLLTVHLPGAISPFTAFSAKARHPGQPQAPQLASGSMASTSSMRGSSQT